MDEAIISVRDYLVLLLHQESWCKARQVGQALEILVNMKGPNVTNSEDPEPVRRTALKEHWRKEKRVDIG